MVNCAKHDQHSMFGDIVNGTDMMMEEICEPGPLQNRNSIFKFYQFKDIKPFLLFLLGFKDIFKMLNVIVKRSCPNVFPLYNH